MKPEVLAQRMINLRADLTAQRMLQDAMLISMTGATRTALAHNFGQLSERWMADYLAQSTSATDDTVYAVQRSIDHVALRLRELPHS